MADTSLEFIRTISLYKGMYRVKVWLKANSPAMANVIAKTIGRFTEENFGGDELRLCKLLMAKFETIIEIEMTGIGGDGVSITRNV